MNPDFAAAQSPSASSRVAVFDFNGTVEVHGEPQWTARLAADLSQNGYRVIIATGGGYTQDRQRGILGGLLSQDEMSRFEFVTKADLHDVLGTAVADVIFDNDPSIDYIPSNFYRQHIQALDVLGQFSVAWINPQTGKRELASENDYDAIKAALLAPPPAAPSPAAAPG